MLRQQAVFCEMTCCASSVLSYMSFQLCFERNPHKSVNKREGWIMFGKFGVAELLVILALVLVIFGPSKLPGLGSALGKTIKDFKSSVSDPEAKKAAETAKAEATKVEVIEAIGEDDN